MDDKKRSIGLFILGSAFVWGLVIIGCALKLKGTDCFDEIVVVLSSGAGIHLLFIWAPLAVRFKKLKEEK